VDTNQFKATFDTIRIEVERALVGQTDLVEHALIALLARGHVLLEGAPGLGKTLLVRVLGQVLACDYRRIQFTPDLMPSDVSGGNVFNQQKGAFEFLKGPVFTQLLLADEINRAPAKTQSALLEAMQE
jgi:MoxR-like ATPase